jgi:hypothetical protein
MGREIPERRRLAGSPVLGPGVVCALRRAVPLRCRYYQLYANHGPAPILQIEDFRRIRTVRAEAAGFQLAPAAPRSDEMTPRRTA